MEERVQPRRFVAIIWKWLWLIILAAVVAAAASYLVTRNQPDVYQTHTTMLVGRSLEQEDVSSADLRLGQQLAVSYAEVAQRSPVRSATMEALGLSWLPSYHVEAVANTQLLEIHVSDTFPERAAQVADELARQLTLLSPQGRQEERRPFIEQQLDDLEATIHATSEDIALLETLESSPGGGDPSDTLAQIAALRQKLATDQGNYAQLLRSLGQGTVNILTVLEPGPGSLRVGSHRPPARGGALR